jgi:hypothetical protein
MAKKINLLNIASPIGIETFPENKFDLAAIFELNNLSGFCGYIDAATQRKLIGYNVFGKQRVFIDCNGQGSVKVSSKAGFGQDWNEATHTFDAVIAAAKSKKQLESY